MSRPMPARNSDALERAHVRVQELRSFYVALFIFVIINVFFWTINLWQGGYLWAIWPTAGWGIGMLAWWASFALRDGNWYFGAKWEEAKVEEIMARENLRVVSQEKERITAQMRILQAQIEPHFLFNTLANVQSLIGREPNKANLMLDHFIGYLRRSLSASRSEHGTFGQEIDLLEHYLHLLKIRMDARLQYTIDIPDDLRAMPLAPMLLQPIVENAVKHGLEPKVEGGTLTIRVSREGPLIRISIGDTGIGFSESAKEGVGLSNLRERLLLLYEGRARLEIMPAHPGTQVIITIPFEEGPA
jgi:sensor histidine kinase YesM